MSMQPKKKSNKFIYILGAIFLLLLVLTIIKFKQEPKGKMITTATAELKTIKETVSASGKIFPETEVKISSDVSGEIVELYVKEGDSVVVGQILAKIDPEAYISSVQRGEANLNSSKAQLAISKSQIETNKAQRDQIIAQLENAKTIHKRNEQLKKDGVISQSELEQSLSTMRQLEANLKAAEAGIRSAQQNAEAADYTIKGSAASLNELKTSLNRTVIKSPTNGIVSSLSVEKGERVVGTMQMTGTELMRISNLGQMQVEVDVNENDILKVAINDNVEIDVDAYSGKKFKGIVTQIANSAANVNSATAALNTDQVTNFVVKIRVLSDSYSDLIKNGNKYPLRPGMSASVDIFTEQVDNVLALPIQCVTIREKVNTDSTGVKNDKQDDYDEVVFLMEADTAKMVVVTTGIQDDEFIQIKDGLTKGAIAISGPYNELSKSLKSGDKVQIKKEGTDK